VLCERWGLPSASSYNAEQCAGPNKNSGWP
jgi:hypothetical protein